MAVYIEDHLPVVKYNGLNTQKAVTMESTLAVTGAITATGGIGSGSAITAPVITGGLTASGSAANDYSGSTGTFKTSTGAVTIGTGALTVSASSSTFDNAVSITGATNFKRQVTSTGGAYATPIVLTTAQSGRVILVDDAAGLDFTLPAIGTSDVGTHFLFLVTVTVTSNNFRVTAAAGDLLFGALPMSDFDTADKVSYFAPNGSSNLVLTCNGSTTGGKKGSWVEYIATSATQWVVRGYLWGDGTLATPFSG